jgi:hypothetical protein
MAARTPAYGQPAHFDIIKFSSAKDFYPQGKAAPTSALREALATWFGTPNAG